MIFTAFSIRPSNCYISNHLYILCSVLSCAKKRLYDFIGVILQGDITVIMVHCLNECTLSNFNASH